MTGKNLDDIEKSLARLSPKAIPPGLRQRVMASALDARKNAGLTTRMRAVALVLAMLAAVAVIGDAIVSKWQSGRIAGLLGSPSVSKPAREEARLLWAELGADLGDLDTFRRERIVLSRLESQDDSRRAFFAARDWLKGMIDHEDPENCY
jgi:glycine/D-amino acid oxidase-like deaminating enzyme